MRGPRTKLSKLDPYLQFIAASKPKDPYAETPVFVTSFPMGVNGESLRRKRSAAGRTAYLASSAQSPAAGTGIPAAKTRPVKVGDAVIGGNSVCVMAGPACVESSAQMLAVGCALQSNGAKFVRASVLRPDARPHEFRGLGERGLKLLRATADRFDLNVVSEIFDPADMRRMVEYCDVIEVGSKNASNYQLLTELGYTDRTILLARNPLMLTEDFLRAVKVLEKGRRCRIVLAESGVRSFDPLAPQMLDLSAIITMKRETPHPVMADCSAAAKNWTYAENIAVGAVAVGADGLMLELQPSPAEAVVKSTKALLPEQLQLMLRRIAAVKCTLNALAHQQCMEVVHSKAVQ